MHKHREWNIVFFLIALAATSGLGWFINSYPPDGFWTHLVFYSFIGISVGFFLQFLFQTPIRSILGSIGIIGILLLRSFGLRHPIYGFLLVAVLISLDVMLHNIRHKA